MNKLFKIRKIAKDSIGYIYGVTIPTSMVHWRDIHVTITESGNCLILTSGTHPSSATFKQLKEDIQVVEKIKI